MLSYLDTLLVLDLFTKIQIRIIKSFWKCHLSSVSTSVVSKSATILSMLIYAVDVSSLMDFSHLGSTSPSTSYGDLPRTSVLMKPSSPRICSSVYSEVYLPEMEY